MQGEAVSETHQDETLVRESRSAVTAVSVAFVVGGAGLGWLTKAGAGWVADLPWAPLQGPFRLIDEITEAEPISTIASLAIGALAGAVVAVLAMADMLRVRLTSEAAVLLRGSEEHRFERSSVGAAYMDGDRLVLLGHAGDELAREKTDLDEERLAEAFRARGYRWFEDDPFAADLRRWVPETPGLPTGADALLMARDKALNKGDKHDVAELRCELAKLGVVVRDEKKRQYWRLVGREPDGR